MKEKPPLIEECQVKRAIMREYLHGHGHHGMYVYCYRCMQFPRLTKEVRREKRGKPEATIYRVDGREVNGTFAAIAKALNRSHNIVGIGDRLNAQRVRPGTVEYVANPTPILIVYGEPAERCEKLRQSFPHFEGIPIDWRANIPDGDSK